MGNALGFFEISGVVAAVNALDIMCKTADVQFVTWEKKLGGRLVTIIIRGNVSAVKEAIEAADKGGIKKPVGKAVIANPHEEIERIVKKSADRLAKTRAEMLGETTSDDKKPRGKKSKDNESYIKEI